MTNEGTISLTINVTRNEPDFVNVGARGDPTIQKKEARTTMLVRDGDTAVIGGIYTRNTGISSARVPFFSDIPILGWFFRNKKENDNRSEFLVFITPRIVNRARTAGQYEGGRTNGLDQLLGARGIGRRRAARPAGPLARGKRCRVM